LLLLWQTSQDMQPTANLCSREFAEIAIDIFEQMSKVFATHLAQRCRGPILGQFFIPLVNMVAVILAQLLAGWTLLRQLAAEVGRTPVQRCGSRGNRAKLLRESVPCRLWPAECFGAQAARRRRKARQSPPPVLVA